MDLGSNLPWLSNGMVVFTEIDPYLLHCNRQPYTQPYSLIVHPIQSHSHWLLGRVCHEYGKTHGFRVMVFAGTGTVSDLAYLCVPMDPCHGVTGTPQVHHRYIMGSNLSVSTALFTITAHGPQQVTSYLLFSPFLIKQLSANFLHGTLIHGTLIYWQLYIYRSNYQFVKLPVLSHNADHFFYNFIIQFWCMANISLHKRSWWLWKPRYIENQL